MSDFTGFIPTLESLVKPLPQFGPATRVLDLVELFHKNPGLLAAPIVAEERFVGFITRKQLFFKRLSNKFALDLFGKEPIVNLLDDRFPVMSPHLDINSALARLLRIDPGLESDCFPVVDIDRFCGIVPVPDLMMALSKTQSLLLESLERMSARIRDEVAEARRIQQALLPSTTFSFRDITVTAGLTTSSEVGGDFYDYFTVGDDRLGLVIGDVSGHGVQAGMVTTAAKASLHTLLALDVTEPAALLAGMNKAIATTTCQTLLMTCLIAVIHVADNRLTMANAGHNFPYRHDGRTGVLTRLDTLSGFPLGLDAGSSYEEFQVSFQRGDSLICYTDGIIECEDHAGEFFGYERLENLLRSHCPAEPSFLGALLHDQACAFTGTTDFQDDVTLLIAAHVDPTA